jgi:hypothetical protein
VRRKQYAQSTSTCTYQEEARHTQGAPVHSAGCTHEYTAQYAHMRTQLRSTHTRAQSRDMLSRGKAYERHTRTQRRMHTRTQRRMHTRIHSAGCTHAYTALDAHTSARRMHTQVHSAGCTRAHSAGCTHAYTALHDYSTCTYGLSACTCVQSTCTRACTRVHTRTQRMEMNRGFWGQSSCMLQCFVVLLSNAITCYSYAACTACACELCILLLFKQVRVDCPAISACSACADTDAMQRADASILLT